MMNAWIPTNWGRGGSIKTHALGKTTKTNPFLSQDEEEYESAQSQGDLEDEAELPF